MSNTLSKIDNPLLRSITAASASLAIVTMVSAVAIGVAKPDDKSANKLGVYASLLAAAGGAVFGFVVGGKSKENKVADTGEAKETDSVWKDWRNFVVSRKVKESNEITSFYLQPQDKGELPDFKPGQFLTIKLDIPEEKRPVIRTYSLSDYSPSEGYYRLSIKREGSPKGLDVPPGVASNFMHDNIQEGAVLPAKPPNGKFFLDVKNAIPAVFISNGVGITPMISMAKACSRLNPSRHTWFLHGARNGEYHACRDEVNGIQNNYSNLHIHYKYSRPRPEDRGNYHSEGYVDKELLETTIIPEIERLHNSPDAEYFLCGSPSFMDSLREGLKELGVAEDRVFFESFSKGGATKAKAEPATTTEGTIDSAEIIFSESGKTLNWTKNDGTLLEFAEANNIDPPYSCRQGICLSCMCAIAEGEVEYTEPPINEPDEGSVLICISKPKTKKVVLDL